MISNNSNHLSDRLAYALKERPSTVTVSSTVDGRYTASYVYDDGNDKKGKLYVSADTIEKALNSLSRKVHSKFHGPDEKPTGEWAKEVRTQ